LLGILQLFFVFLFLLDNKRNPVMTNNEKYELLSQGDSGLASIMGIIPRNNDLELTSTLIEQSLKKNKDFKLIKYSTLNHEAIFYLSAFSAEIEYLNHTYAVDIYVAQTETLMLEDYGFANNIDKESLEAAREQKVYLETSMFFSENNLASFHLQMKIMNAIIPDASVVIDFMSYRLLSAQWLAMSARSSIPPSPDYLYTLHCVYDQESKDDNKRYWFHTHGLQRCGSVELEMVNITQGIEQMHTLMNMTVKKFLTDPAKEKETFAIGFDGMGINLCWLRWEEALKDFPKDILGGINDRKEEGDIHAGPSGIIFAVEDKNMTSPEIYAPTLADNPIYYISTEETNRMSCLAKERFVMFREVFEKENPWKGKKSFMKNLFGSKKPGDSPWAFLVKLGLTVDNAESENDKEHLWFEILSINDNEIEAKLLNQPYWIASIKEGGVYKYPVDLLTDWIIYGPESTYTSDSIYELGFK